MALEFIKQDESKLIPGPYYPSTEQEAWVILLWYGMGSDGKINAIEKQWSTYYLVRNDIFQDIDVGSLIKRVDKLILSHKINDLVTGAAKKIPIEKHQALFMILADILMAGGYWNTFEEEFLKHIVELFNLDTDFVGFAIKAATILHSQDKIINKLIN